MYTLLRFYHQEVKKVKVILNIVLAILFALSFYSLAPAKACQGKDAKPKNLTLAQGAQEDEGEAAEDEGSEGEVYDDDGESDDQGYDDQGYDDVEDGNSGEVEDPNGVEEPAQTEEPTEN